MDLSTSFMNLSLPNPVIVSSSSLTATIDGVKNAVNAGAGAVVLKSLFEEDIAAGVERSRKDAAISHSEAEAYMEQLGMLLEPDAYLTLVEESVQAVDVPVIASLNCYSDKWWTDYAERIENVGADAIELNLSPIALDQKTSAKDIENMLVNMVKLARKTVKLPLAVKIGQNYSALPHLANRIRQAGANSLTLFNRYYKFDIDIEELSFKSGNSLSAKEEFGPVLRWIGILSDITELDISASTGVYDASDLIKVLLAGGNAAQFCSVLYREGLEVIGKVLIDLTAWMEKHNYSNLSEFQSLLSHEDDKNNAFYQRLQYVKALRDK
ncbi:MAG: dihydroorotate oxidase [Spirochaetes bacterium]|nr:MAG: dihydroorotate oxidase [Spirochaetota bacterium]